MDNQEVNVLHLRPVSFVDTFHDLRISSPCNVLFISMAWTNDPT
jgi:hypothetical protein